MKPNNLILITVLFLVLLNSVFAQEIILDEKNSSIKWTGKEITSKTHYGSLKFKEGKIRMKGEKILSGTFIVDMRSINCQDLSGKSKNYLESHLKSEEFFGVEDYPEASLSIRTSKLKSDGNHVVEGDIKIKGITEAISFNISIQNKEGKAKLIFDRTKHNVTYRSGNFFQNLGDKLIYDDIEIEAQLTFN
jgi:polyisoprenoid-binding protein YceI